MTETDRTKYLRIALLLVGVIFIVGIYPLTIIWPSGLVVAHGPVGLPADDSRHLRDAGRVPAGCFSQPARTLKPHLVHGVVQRCARRNHGGTVFRELRAHGTPLGRRTCAICCSGRPCASDATRCGSKARLSARLTTEPCACQVLYPAAPFFFLNSAHRFRVASPIRFRAAALMVRFLVAFGAAAFVPCPFFTAAHRFR